MGLGHEPVDSTDPGQDVGFASNVVGGEDGVNGVTESPTDDTRFTITRCHDSLNPF
jgi:hypothetical protein